MDILSTALIGIGLSMDAFAVSVSNGIIINELKVGHALKTALFFGAFQTLMPLAGWLAGSQLKDCIVAVDHWIAFGLLAFIGAKMVYEAITGDDEGKRTVEDRCEVAVVSQGTVCENPLKTGRLLLLAVATSIDALAVGVSFAFLRVSIIRSAVLIGIITFGICFAGVYIGKKFGDLMEKKAEIIGGLILVGIGLKILLEHLGIIPLV